MAGLKRLTNFPLSLFLLFCFLFVSCQFQKSAPQAEKIVIWHWMTDRETAFEELSKRYHQETGRSVEFQLYAPTVAYQQKIRVAAQTSNLPDIFGILEEPRVVANYIKAHHVVNLTSYLSEGDDSWKENFYQDAIKTAYFSPENQFGVSEGYYGIPLDDSTIPMLYNKELFQKAGLDPDKPPGTWEEFIEAGKALKKSGVSGFVSGWSETWLIFSMMTDLAHNLMGAKKVMATFRGEVPYTDPDWVRVFDAFEQMYQARIADPSLVSLQNKNAELSFASGRAGMAFNGSWAVNVFEGMAPHLRYAPFRVPALNPKNPRPVWGGAGTVFFVNRSSAKKEKAIEFLKWLTAKPQMAYLVKTTKNLPSVKAVKAGMSPLLTEFADLMTGSIHPNRFSASEDPRVQEALSKGIQSILIGEITPGELAVNVQSVKKKVRAKP